MTEIPDIFSGCQNLNVCNDQLSTLITSLVCLKATHESLQNRESHYLGMSNSIRNEIEPQRTDAYIVYRVLYENDVSTFKRPPRLGYFIPQSQD